MKVKRQLLSADGDSVSYDKGRAVRISAQLAAVLANMQDKKKRDEFIKALSYLSKQEQESLKAQLDAAPSDLDRWIILSQVVNSIQSSQGYQMDMSSEEMEAKRKKQMLAFSFLAILVGGAFVYLIIKKA